MSRKDYELIAGTLKALRRPDDAAHEAARAEIARAMADRLEAANSTFQAARFLKAAMVAA